MLSLIYFQRRPLDSKQLLLLIVFFLQSIFTHYLILLLRLLSPRLVLRAWLMFPPRLLRCTRLLSSLHVGLDRRTRLITLLQLLQPLGQQASSDGPILGSRTSGL